MQFMFSSYIEFFIPRNVMILQILFSESFMMLHKQVHRILYAERFKS